MMNHYLCEEYNGYLLIETTSGGKAGKGYNRTSSIKIMSLDRRMKYGRYFSFWKAFDLDKKRAVEKAKTYIDFHLNKSK